MATLQIEPLGISLQVDSGTSLIDVNEKYSLGLLLGCRKGACGACTIEVLYSSENLSEIQETERNFLERKKLSSNCRLACQCAIRGDVAIRLRVQSKLNQSTKENR